MTNSHEVIPEAAVEAARDVLYENDRSIDVDYATLEAALEAAAPHMQADLLAALVDAMSAWAGDSELGFMEGALEAARESTQTP